MHILLDHQRNDERKRARTKQRCVSATHVRDGGAPRDAAALPAHACCDRLGERPAPSSGWRIT
eukprot:784332-Pleurochrysis_carterae.AAC.1